MEIVTQESVFIAKIKLCETTQRRPENIQRAPQYYDVLRATRGRKF